jgi:hypothetical protein
VVASIADPETKRAAAEFRVAAECSLSAIKKAIKGGTEVPGADVDFHESLVIR